VISDNLIPENDIKEYEKRSYQELSSEFQKLYPRAVELIPLMYNRLTLVEKLSHKKALAKIYNDHQHLSRAGFSKRNIRRNLPLDNATVPRRIRPSRPKNSQGTSGGATVQEQKMVAMTEETIDDNNEAKAPSTNKMNSVSFVEQTPCANTENVNHTSLVAVDKLERNRSDLEKCPNCSVLRLRNQELEEALREATLDSRGEESEIEYSLPYLEVQRYMAAEYKRGGSKVWFSVKINAETKEVTSAKTGRISVDIN
jgi:hypothetical protein